MIIRVLLFTALCLLASNLALGADDVNYPIGLKAYQENDFERAVKYWNNASKRDDASAQYSLGLMYEHGQFVDRDIRKATGLLKNSAQAGHPLAQYHLNILYAEDETIGIDFKKAANWYQKSASSQSLKHSMI